MTRTQRLLAILTCVAGAAACGDDGVDVETYDLVFQGDATFQNAHGGQAIAVALVDDGNVVESGTGTVSANDDPSFSFTFPGALNPGESYEVHYWIDSNFGGGTEGVCDPPDNDHQWKVAFGPVAANVTLTEDHAPAETTSVCSTF